MEHELEGQKTHLDLVTLIIRSLQTQENQQVVVDVTGHEEEEALRALTNEQRLIGWDKFKLGFWASQWTVLQGDYLRQRNMRQKASTWAAKA